MFRAEIRWAANGPILKMEGRLVGAWAEQASSLITTELIPKGLIVDLTDISYVDAVGEQLLICLSSIGAKFAAMNVYAAGLCERLGLPLLGGVSARHVQNSVNRDDQASPITPGD